MGSRWWLAGWVVVGGLVVCAVSVCDGRPGEAKVSTDKALVVVKARGAGRWFPAQGPELRAVVTQALEGAVVPRGAGRLVGVMAPHAGYVYSGKVAGYAFRALQEAAATEPGVETVVVLGFSHRAGFPGVAVLDGDAVETPLGRTPLDREAAAFLVAGSPRVTLDSAPHAGEHSAENQVPFVQVSAPKAKLVIALTGDHDGRTLDALVAGLEGLARKRRMVVVASTDMLHHADWDLVTRTDKSTLAKVEAMDVDGLLRSWGYDNQVFCGMAPVAVLMRYARGQGVVRGEVLHYRNSGDDFPESRGEWVVGYGAVRFSGTQAGP
jgi:hypothetical protein